MIRPWSTTGRTMRCTRGATMRCTTGRTMRRDRCGELRLVRVVALELGEVSVLTRRPRCLVRAPSVRGYGRA